MSHLKTKLFSHKQAVCSLYKAIARQYESMITERDEARFQIVQLRAEFDRNKDINDPRVAKKLLMDAQIKLEEMGLINIIRFPTSPYGCAHDRWNALPDVCLDYWHPYEKAQYPKYFATREKRKLEYIEIYEKDLNAEKQEASELH